MTPLLFLLNEAATFLTIIIVFPGVLSRNDAVGWGVAAVLLFVMSFVWWIYLAISPIAFLIAWIFGGLTLDYWRREWPWNVFLTHPKGEK